jgi:hypothetical protein
MTMNTRRIIVAVIVIVLAGAAAFGWFRFVARPRSVVCGYCMRPLHDNLMVTAEIDGKRAEVCCPRCAITEANQQQKPLRMITVHDYRTGKALSPETAWFVEGSRAMACNHDAMRMNEMKGTQELAFDRCSPGTFTFADKQQADAFTQANGGTVLSFQQLMREARFQ